MRKFVLMLAAAASILALIPAPSNANTCAAADPTADAVVCGVVYGAVVEACQSKPLNEICKRLQ